MKPFSVKMAPPNSVILVSDLAGGEVPQSMNGQAISRTDTCVAVGCLAENDGDTEITLGYLRDLDRHDPPAFEGTIYSKNKKLSVQTVFGSILMALSVSNEFVKVKVWINDAYEPDIVVIAIE